MQPQYIELPKNAKDITGRRTGRLVALGPVENSGHGTVWEFLCDCGNRINALAGKIHKARKQSCGCLRKEGPIQHGRTRFPVYKTWNAMIHRCTDPGDSRYKDYGRRGITVCEEWQHSIKTFCDHVSKLPHYGEKGYSLDRIDNDGNYEPGNVRWATRSEQGRNTRLNHMITYNGITQCTIAWAEQLGIIDSTITSRLRSGWSVERALMTPPRK